MKEELFVILWDKLSVFLPVFDRTHPSKPRLYPFVVVIVYISVYKRRGISGGAGLAFGEDRQFGFERAEEAFRSGIPVAAFALRHALREPVRPEIFSVAFTLVLPASVGVDYYPFMRYGKAI